MTRSKPEACGTCRYGSLRDRRWCGPEIATSASAAPWIIAENPGETEAEHGKPLHPEGASGREVRWAMSEAGVVANLGNVRCCRLPKEEVRGAFEASAAYCLNTYTSAVMENPRRIVLLGGKALRAFMGLGDGTPFGQTTFHGSMWTREQAEAVREEFSDVVLAPLPESVEIVTSVLHPSFALRGKPALKPLIREAIKRGLTAQPIDLHQSVEVAVGQAEMISFLGQNKILALDVETGADGKIEIVGLSNGRRTVVMSSSIGLNDAVGAWLAEPEHTVIGHNIGYDIGCYLKLGVDVRCVIVDTMDAASVAHPGVADMAWHGLQTCALRYIDGICSWKPRRYESRGAYMIDWRYAHTIYRTMRPDLPSWLYEQFYCGLDVLWSWCMWMGVPA